MHNWETELSMSSIVVVGTEVYPNMLQKALRHPIAGKHSPTLIDLDLDKTDRGFTMHSVEKPQGAKRGA